MKIVSRNLYCYYEEDDDEFDTLFPNCESEEEKEEIYEDLFNKFIS